MPTLPVHEFGWAAGPQPQLHPHPTGDPCPTERAEGLPPNIPAGEENNHCRMHMCHPLDPTPGLKAASSVRAGSYGEQLLFLTALK